MIWKVNDLTGEGHKGYEWANGVMLLIWGGSLGPWSAL